MPVAQIAVLDVGGQYCHLIARKVRELGVYAEVLPSDTPIDKLKGRKGVIISGGPSSVYEPDSPPVDEALLQQTEAGILGICYGLQWMAHRLGGSVRAGQRGEYGQAQLVVRREHPLFAGIGAVSRVWMSHRDVVTQAPEGFEILAQTSNCEVAAMGHRERPWVAVQFHPEVVHTEYGNQILSNFVFGICGCERDWNPKDRIGPIEGEIKRLVRDRKIFFFVSGGVDSTVAYTLCLRALGPERVYGIYVDTGLMRENESDYVQALFERLGAKAFHMERASREFLDALQGVCDPEEKRHIIGEKFVEVQERILKSGSFLSGDWILGQGTIYPDTIESGGTFSSDRIKTHHNRVPGIQKLIDEGRIVEPLARFYKDEVRAIGQDLGLPRDLLDRHPFPGPGLAIRCLCSPETAELAARPEGWLVPIRSVGVQGDARSYRPVLLLDKPPSDEALQHATRLVNEVPDVNRVVAKVASRMDIERQGVTRGMLSEDRLVKLQRADSIIRRLSIEQGFENTVWQFPVILIPFGDAHAPDSIVLRPVDSLDGMTAQAVLMPPKLLEELARELLEIEGVASVLYDLTHKPPGTIEWE